MATGQEYKITKGGITDVGVEARKKQLAGADYKKNKEYGVNEDSYNYSDKNPLGKGTSTQTSDYVTIGSATSSPQFDTNDGGNSYDRYGSIGAGGKSGRENLKTLNKYTPESYYGVNSPKSDENMVDINISGNRSQISATIIRKK